MEHNSKYIDWLRVAKPSVDKNGFGLFAMQDISEYKLVTLYLGDVFTTEHRKNKAIGNKTYTLLSHVTYSEYRGWSQNKKKSMYVVPKLKKKTWKDNVDEIYIEVILLMSSKVRTRRLPMLLSVTTSRFIVCRILKQEMNF